MQRCTPRRSRLTLLAAAVTTTMLAGACSPAVGVNARAQPRIVLGVTHAQHSLDPGGDIGAIAQATALLSAHPGMLQNMYVYGWGARNPEPRSGVYDWTDLDRRMSLVRRTHGTPVITLCCAPDWMKGAAPGTSDPAHISYAPYMSHYADFAHLAKAIARRYPDVRHFQVWSEMRGFSDPRTGGWRTDNYTKLYNLVYDTLKALNPAIKVGGPYVSIRTWAPGARYASSLSGAWGVVDQRDLDVVTYWLAHAHGADFVAVDGSTLAFGNPRRLLTSAYTSTDKFRVVTRWIVARTRLPVWWSEFYAVPYDNPTGISDREQARVLARGLQQAQAGGASVALMWEPEGKGATTWPGLWTPTSKRYGGAPTVLFGAASSFLRRPAR